MSRDQAHETPVADQSTGKNAVPKFVDELALCQTETVSGRVLFKHHAIPVIDVEQFNYFSIKKLSGN